MKITQLSVFLENVPGKLTVPCRVLAGAGVNIMAVSLADTNRFGLLRLIVDDPPTALQALTAADCIVETGDVIAIAIGDHPGGLDDVLEIIEAEEINLEYLYSFTRPLGPCIVVVCSFTNTDDAIAALRAANVTIIDNLTDLNDLTQGDA